MALAHLSMLNNELLNKDSDVVPEQPPFIILYIKLAIFMDKNGDYTKHIVRRIHLVRNSEE